MTQIDELLQAGASGHKKAWQMLKRNKVLEDGRVFAKEGKSYIGCKPSVSISSSIFRVASWHLAPGFLSFACFSAFFCVFDRSMWSVNEFKRVATLSLPCLPPLPFH